MVVVTELRAMVTCNEVICRTSANTRKVLFHPAATGSTRVRAII